MTLFCNLFIERPSYLQFCLSVCLSVCHAGEPHVSGSTHQNVFHTTW